VLVDENQPTSRALCGVRVRQLGDQIQHDVYRALIVACFGPPIVDEWDVP
jgi:hypothetical protein